MSPALGLLMAGLCFAFNLAHYWVGGRLYAAERALHPRRSARWAVASEALQWLDYVVFAAVAFEAGVWEAALWCVLPSLVGAYLGEHRAIRKEWVDERIREKKRRLARWMRAALAPAEKSA